MPSFKRRQFLQFSASAFAGIGLNQLAFLAQADRYKNAIAQSSQQKLALLVGINGYPSGISSLGGCVTDVRMQYELLVHRFGFDPKDIIILSDEPENLPSDSLVRPPTRANILETFEKHLIEQAQTDDIVVFHYSGHGSQVIDPDPIPQFNGYNGTLVPVDARSANPAEGTVDDIMGKTLFLLTYLLKTDRVTTILDSCYSGGGTRGNLVYRSIDTNSRLELGSQPSEKEKAYQAYLLDKAELTEQQLLELRTAGIAKGFALGSAQASQLSADATFGEGQAQFKAGAFTYTLTRYLWQQSVSQPLDSVFVKLAHSTHDVANDSGMIQEPIYYLASSCSDCSQKPAYFITPETPSAEAVITKADGEIEFWLGGISSRSLGAFISGAVFNLVDTNGQVIGEVEQTGRRGLIGTGKLVGAATTTVQAGLFLREQIRGVPANPKLKIGLHTSLRDEMVIAESALAEISRIEVLPIDPTNELDYIFGRMNADAAFQAQAHSVRTMPPQGSLCLFTRSLVPVPNSWHTENPNETVFDAINQRLKSRLKMLLAGRILKYVLNIDRYAIRLDADVETVSGGENRSRFSRQGTVESGLTVQTLEVNRQQLTAGSEIQVVLKNNEDHALYIAVVVVESTGELVILHPLTADSAEVEAILPSGETLIVPQRQETSDSNSFKFTVEGPAGFFELLVLASTDPLRDALKALEQVAGIRGGDGETPYVLDGDEAVNVISALLGDLDRSSRSGGSSYQSENLGVDTTKLAAISAIFEVVESH